MSSSNFSVDEVGTSGAEQTSSDYSTNPDWSSSTFNLQLETSFSGKSPSTPSQTIEDMVLEFEESGQEIGDILVNLGKLKQHFYYFNPSSNIHIQMHQTLFLRKVVKSSVP